MCSSHRHAFSQSGDTRLLPATWAIETSQRVRLGRNRRNRDWFQCWRKSWLAGVGDTTQYLCFMGSEGLFKANFDRTPFLPPLLILERRFSLCSSEKADSPFCESPLSVKLKVGRCGVIISITIIHDSGKSSLSITEKRCIPRSHPEASTSVERG